MSIGRREDWERELDRLEAQESAHTQEDQRRRRELFELIFAREQDPQGDAKDAALFAELRDAEARGEVVVVKQGAAVGRIRADADGVVRLRRR